MLTNCEDAVIAMRMNATQLRDALHGRPDNRGTKLLRELAAANDYWAAQLMRIQRQRRRSRA
jgi:hypothetical protein